MAQASADPDERDLEQRILQVLKDAGSPVKTAQLAKECQVLKKRLNQVLYGMKKELKVDLVGPATWRLGVGGTGEVVPTEPAQPSHGIGRDGNIKDKRAIGQLPPALSLLGTKPETRACALIAERPPQGTVAIPQKPGSQLSEQQEQIYRFLKAGGPCKALVIAQSLGMKTAKDVNPVLYDMRRKHLLDLDQNSKAWAIYQPEEPRETRQSTMIVYQQNPITICQNAPHSRISIDNSEAVQIGYGTICQNAPPSCISINNSEAVQIGHGNSIVRQTAPGESGFTAPLYLPQPAPADPSTQDALAGSREPQDIYIDKSVLKRVQLGHSNEMSLYSTPAMGPGHSPSVSSSSVSPPASATTAGPEASFEVRMPTPGPSPEGKGDTTQRVHIKSCFLEEVAIGNSNRMSVGLAAAGPGGGAGPENSSGDPGEPTEDAEPQSEAAEPQSEAAEPQSEAAEPQSGPAEPRSGAAEPQSEAAEPQSEAAEPQSGAAEPRSGAAEPQSEAAEPQSGAAEPRSGAAEPRSGAAEPQSGAPEPQSGAAEPRSGAAEPRGKSPHYDGRADLNMSTFTSHLEAMTLEGKDPEAAKDGP